MKKISLLLVLSFFVIGAYSQTRIPENSTSPLYYRDGKIGIGTDNPGSGVSSDPNLKLHVTGGITLNTGYRLSLDQNYSVHGYLQYDSSLPDGRLLYYGYYGHRWHTSGGEFMRLTRSGNLGIGTTSPVEKLHVNGNITFYNGSQGNGLGTDVDGNLVLYRNAVSTNTPSMVINDESGNVGIGTTSPANKLDVNGTIRAKEVKVKTGWADFVFEKDYSLPSIEKVAQFIEDNGHLPGIPTAEEVKENGVSLGEMNQKLLQKIEELTLYMIEKDKQIAELKEEIEGIYEKLK